MYVCAVSKGIVDLHKGRVCVCSEGEGRGSTFTLDIPAASETIPAEAVEEKDDSVVSLHGSGRSVLRTGCSSNVSRVYIIDGSVEDDQEEVAFQHMSLGANALGMAERSESRDGRRSGWTDSSSFASRLRVLVVDDAASNRKLLIRLLRKKYLLSEAEDGQQAVDMVVHSSTTDKFDVVLMVNCMPNMCGPAAARAMRGAGYTGLIIGITGNALPSDMRVYLDSGADKVLSKPVDARALQALISGA